MKVWGFGVVAVLAALGCARLGFWQLARLEQRRALNRTIAQRVERPPVPLTDLDWTAPDVTYRRVSVSGRYDVARPIVEVFRSRNGVPGAFLVSALMLDSARAVLVERGWAPAPDARTIDPSRFASADSVTVVGYVRDPRRGDSVGIDPDAFPLYLRTADPRALTEAFPYEILPVVVRRTGGTESPGLASLPGPELTEGSHLSYAVQWFSFGSITLVGAVIWIRRQRREDGPAV